MTDSSATLCAAAPRCAASPNASARRRRCDGVDARSSRRRGPGADRRERRRQEHADEGALPARMNPTRATMSLAGEPFRPASPHDARRAGVAMIYQELTLAPDLNVVENVMLGQERQPRGLAPRRRAAPLGSRSACADSVTPICRSIGRCVTLSTARQQIVEIARALVRAGQARRLRRADEFAHAARRAAAVRRDSHDEAGRPRRRLHQPLSRRDSRSRRSLHRAARRRKPSAAASCAACRSARSSR